MRVVRDAPFHRVPTDDGSELVLGVAGGEAALVLPRGAGRRQVTVLLSGSECRTLGDAVAAATSRRRDAGATLVAGDLELALRYDNRGDPYAEGVSLTLSDVASQEQLSHLSVFSGATDLGTALAEVAGRLGDGET